MHSERSPRRVKSLFITIMLMSPLLFVITTGVSSSAPPVQAVNQTITYTSFSTITEGTTTGTITILVFNTTTSRTIEATMMVVKYVTTTTVFVEVERGVTKAAYMILTVTTTTLSQPMTQIEQHFIETKTVEQTLTTYGPPTTEDGIEWGVRLFVTCMALLLLSVLVFFLMSPGHHHSEVLGQTG